MQHRKATEALSAAVAQALRDGDDALIERALAGATSDSVWRTLSAALDDNLKAAGGGTLHLGLFCIPILIVTGGRGPLVISGVVPDIRELTSLFEVHGTLGALKNFALNGALASAEGLAALKFSALYRRCAATVHDVQPLDLAPENIQVSGTGEEVHLRFLTGISAVPAGAPEFAETAGNIAAWGMPFTKALAAQLAQPGLSILPLARPPMSPLRALRAGKFAHGELGLQLFLASALRSFRSRVGEAEAVVAARADSSVLVRLESPFDASLSQQYCWTVHPGDDMAAISNSIFGLLADCRVTNIQVDESVQEVEPLH